MIQQPSGLQTLPMVSRKGAQVGEKTEELFMKIITIYKQNHRNANVTQKSTKMTLKSKAPKNKPFTNKLKPFTGIVVYFDPFCRLWFK